MVNSSADDFDKPAFVDGAHVAYAMPDGYIHNGTSNTGICFMTGNGFECLTEANTSYPYLDTHDKPTWSLPAKHSCLESKPDGTEGPTV